MECSLNVIPVEVPFIPNGFSYPGFVNLQRCLGGCAFKSPSIIHCAAKDTSTVDVTVLEFNSHTGGFISKDLKMVNHMECDCECIVQEHHCDNATEIYNPDHCKCMCKNLEHTCDTTIKVTILLCYSEGGNPNKNSTIMNLKVVFFYYDHFIQFVYNSIFKKNVFSNFI